MGITRIFILLAIGVQCINTVRYDEIQQDCKREEYFEPGTLSCVSCPVNSSMVTASDGVSCSCDDNSIEAGGVCRACAATEMRASDRGGCVPRKCQNVRGRTACRKCPGGYISVTQNLDGSPMKEVQCIKCASGFKPQGSLCVRCKACSCSKQETDIQGECLPREFVKNRPKYNGGKVQDEILEVVKNEYLCMKNDVHACRRLASACVQSLYSSDLGGPCRLWLLPKTVPYKHLPPLNFDRNVSGKNDNDITLPKKTSALKLNFVVHTINGGYRMIREASRAFECSAPVDIKLGEDVAKECAINLSQLSDETRGTISPYLNMDGKLKPLPVYLKTPSGSYLQRGSWSITKFRRYFIQSNSTSSVTNVTSTIYLRTLAIILRLHRANVTSSVTVRLTLEASYATVSRSSTVKTSLSIQNETPSPGVLKGLEIWGSVLGTCLCAYAAVVWRGAVRRGGAAVSLLPLLAGAVADALYFAAWFSTLYAAAVETGFSGVTFTMSEREKNMVEAFVYSAVSIKVLKVLWINWKQCSCDIFFLDWSKYNPSYKEVATESSSWRASCLAREWSRIQTKRRTSLWHTIALALCVVFLTHSWHSHLPPIYRWSIIMASWWAAYVTVHLLSWSMDRVSQPITGDLPKICHAVGMSLLVFQEEYLAHYIHGRNDESLDTRIMSGPLKTCRIVCAPHLRSIYKQLLTSVPGIIGDMESRYVLLSKLLAAFFEKALDGLSWVASERTLLERLLDVELTAREAANISLLLYDASDAAPSCLNVTWWGEEWSLATLDAMVFGCALIITGDQYLAAFISIINWQSLKILRSAFGDRNQMEKTRVNKHFD